MKLRTLISIAVALALVLALVPAMAFAVEVTGSFTVGNAPPEVVSITISPSSMTPQQEWTYINVTVKDCNYLSDVNTVKVTVFYDQWQ